MSWPQSAHAGPAKAAASVSAKENLLCVTLEKLRHNFESETFASNLARTKTKKKAKARPAPDFRPTRPASYTHFREA